MRLRKATNSWCRCRARRTASWCHGEHSRGSPLPRNPGPWATRVGCDRGPGSETSHRPRARWHDRAGSDKDPPHRAPFQRKTDRSIASNSCCGEAGRRRLGRLNVPWILKVRWSRLPGGRSSGFPQAACSSTYAGAEGPPSHRKPNGAVPAGVHRRDHSNAARRHLPTVALVQFNCAAISVQCPIFCTGWIVSVAQLLVC